MQQLGSTTVQFSSVAQSCPTLCDPMNHSTPGLPVHHQLPEFTQTHVHRVSDAIQLSSSVVPFSSCPQSIPASESSNESTLRMRWPKYGVSVLASFPQPRYYHIKWSKLERETFFINKGHAKFYKQLFYTQYQYLLTFSFCSEGKWFWDKLGNLLESRMSNY